MSEIFPVDPATGQLLTRRPHTCGSCPATWTGSRTAHCAACHETFTGVGPFDQHRRNGACVDPAVAGLNEAGRNYPCWGTGNEADRVD